MFRRYLYIALALGVTAGLIGLGSALFTSTQTVAANTFTAGTVIISTNPATDLVSFSNMAPGDAVSAPITVSNDGTLTLRYAITSTATNADAKGLRGQLLLTVKSGVTTCDNGNYAADGTTIYGPAVLGNSASLNIVGDPTVGGQTGDRTLPPTTSNTEVLCFHVSLPTNSGNAFQGAATTATFGFIAEQTANN